MLIVNADDWGRTPAETEAALSCFLQGRVTSVTAMTFMIDSERAAAIALEHRIPVGLHLNFTEALTAPRVNPVLMTDHRRVAKFLNTTRYSAVVPNPFLRQSICSAFKFQLDEFIRLYKKPPTHFDGHRHFHLCLNMLLAAPISRGQKVRRTFSFTAQEKGLVNWLYRRALDRWVLARYLTTDYFFALSQRMNRAAFADVARLAHQASVELMTHPIVPAERDLLLHRDLDQQLAGVALGNYGDL